MGTCKEKEKESVAVDRTVGGGTAPYNYSYVHSIFSPVHSSSISPLEAFLKERKIPLDGISKLKEVYYSTGRGARADGSSDPVHAVRQCKTSYRPTLLQRIDQDNPRECSTAYSLQTPSLAPIGDDYTFLSRIFTEEYKRKEEFINDIRIYVMRHGGADSVDEPSDHSEMDQYDSRSIASIIMGIVRDQEGSRFIQKRLDYSSASEWLWLADHIDVRETSTDIFGNYVVQKLLDNDECHRRIVARVRGSMTELSRDTYGCRVVQKMVDKMSTGDYAQLVAELDMLALVYDSNGNHVVQKMVEREMVAHIDVFERECVALSMNKYGCRVVQRLLEYNECGRMVDMLIECADVLAVNQYGNYVLQHIMRVNGTDGDNVERVCAMLCENVCTYAQHKFASNVVERMVMLCDEKWLSVLIDKMCGRMVEIAMDKYGNYVVQRLLDRVGKDSKVCEVLRIGVDAMKGCVYAKQVLLRIKKC